MIKAITYILENDSTVASLCGMNAASVKTKVYPVIVPSSEVEPYIAVRLTSKKLIGKGCGYEYGFQVSTYATSYDAVTALNDAVVSALKNQAPATVNGVDIGWINFITEHDEFAVDRISITYEHPVYMKVATFEASE